MARGKRPATFRTRKLSLPAPMVLPRGRGGRVGRRRTTITERGSELNALTPVRVVRSSAPDGFARRAFVRNPLNEVLKAMTTPRGGSGGSRGSRGSGDG